MNLKMKLWKIDLKNFKLIFHDGLVAQRYQGTLLYEKHPKRRQLVYFK